MIITRNMVAAGNLTLHLLRSNFAELDAPVTIPAPPMGTSVQVFNFGCNGAALAGNPFYGLKLESPDSPFGAYSWRGVGGNPYARPGPGGRGWRNVNAGAGNWTNLGAWDYAFQDLHVRLAIRNSEKTDRFIRSFRGSLPRNSRSKTAS